MNRATLMAAPMTDPEDEFYRIHEADGAFFKAAPTPFAGFDKRNDY